MDDLKEKLLERSTMFWIRMIIRFMAWAVLTFLVVYTIIKPIINEKDIHFSTGVTQVYFWCGLALLAVESIKKIYDMVIAWRFGKEKEKEKDKENLEKK